MGQHPAAPRADEGVREARTAAQRARLVRAEAEVLAHYGVEVDAERLPLEDLGTTVRVVRTGEGPPVLLLHGAGMAATVWAPLLPHLGGRCLYVVDLPGCGLSDPFDYTGVDIVAHQEAFAGAVLDALGLERAGSDERDDDPRALPLEDARPPRGGDRRGAGVLRGAGPPALG